MAAHFIRRFFSPKLPFSHRGYKSWTRQICHISPSARKLSCGAEMGHILGGRLATDCSQAGCQDLETEIFLHILAQHKDTVSGMQQQQRRARGDGVAPIRYRMSAPPFLH